MDPYTNTVRVDGEYRSSEVFDISEAAVELTAFKITKTADKKIWVDGPLGFTIVVTNIDDNTPGYPVESVVVTDTITPTIASLIESSLEIRIGDDPTPIPDPEFEYIPATGLLTVNLDDIPSKGYATITFLVNRV